MRPEQVVRAVIGASRAVLLAEAVVLLGGAAGSRAVAPVLDGQRLPAVVVSAAFGVLLLWSGISRLVVIARRRSALAAVLADLALTAPVTVFLVALLNGVTDVLALVPLYALTTAAWLLAVLQPRVEVLRGHPMLPLCFGAGVGIVPWGVIALAQVAGDAPAAVRVATLVALAGQLIVAVLLWRTIRVPARPRRIIAVDVAATLAISVTAWSAVLLS